jgi:uncharacterized protein
MNNSGKSNSLHLLERFSLFVESHSLWIVILYTIISVFAIHYAVQNLGINSNTAEMFDPDLEFRQNQDHFNELFPLTKNNLVIVIEGETPEVTDISALELYSEIKKDTLHFSNVYLPGAGDFFKQNQFLFLNTDELENLSARLSRSNVFLSLLAQNNSMRGLFSLLDLILEQGNEQQVLQLNNLFGQISATINDRVEFGNTSLSWQQAFGGTELTAQAGIRFIQVQLNLDADRIMPAKEGIEAARLLSKKFSESEKVQVRITGKQAMGYEEMQSVTEGAVTASVLALIFVTLILWIGLRSARLIGSSILTLLAGLFITLAFTAWAIGELNMISVAFAVLYIGLGIDYAIHFTLKFNEFILGKQSMGNAFFNSIKDVGPALLLTCLSTAIGFYAFLPTTFDGVSELGLIAGTGMFISFIVTFTLLPALLNLLRHHIHDTSDVTLTAPFSETLSGILNRRKNAIRSIGIIAAVASLVFIHAIEFDYDPMNLRDQKSESVSTLIDLIREERLSPWNVEILEEDRSEVKENVEALKTIESSGQVLSVFSFVPENQDEKREIIKQVNSRISRIPAIRKDSAALDIANQIESVSLLENSVRDYTKTRPENLDHLQESLELLNRTLDELSVNEKKNLIENVEEGLLEYFPVMLSNLRKASSPNPVTIDSLPPLLKNRWITENGELFRIQVSPAAGIDDPQSLRSFSTNVREFDPDATGELITFIESGNIVVEAFTKAIIYSLLAITILLLIYLRSFVYTIYILLPLFLVALLTGAAMVIFDVKFNFANIIALPMLLGLGVDNAIHMVHRAKEGTIASKDLLKTTTSRAIFFSSLTTLFSFGNLMVSPHSGTASLGLVLLFGILFLIFSTLIVLPAFLIRGKN